MTQDNERVFVSASAILSASESATAKQAVMIALLFVELFNYGEENDGDKEKD